MPTYDYSPTSGNCGRCGGIFTVEQRIADAKLEKCPVCAEPCERRISAVAVHGRFSMSPSAIEKSGFTAYRKNSDGFYDRFAGKGGPKRLLND